MLKQLVCLGLAFCFVSTLSGQGPGTGEDRPRKNILNTSIFSPLMGHLQLGYERYFTKGQALDVKFGLMNVVPIGIKTHPDLRGQYLKVGPKFILGYKKRLPGVSVLQGFYLRPELLLAHSTHMDYRHANGLPYQELEFKARSIAFGAALSGGYQYIHKERLALDASLGLGAGIAIDNSAELGRGPYYYGFMFAGDYVVVTCNFAVGYVF